MIRSANSLNKGHEMEELLRTYFIKSGYYAVRGVPFKYEGFDVTDIDLWLYGRTSSASREIAIVDSKNKKTPQAIERIFWIHGLKTAIKADTAIVATTEKRQAIKDFGAELNILVLDGHFLGRLDRSESTQDLRLSDEELFDLIDEYSLNKLAGDWKGRLVHCKSLLTRGLSFDSCNEWMMHARFFAEQGIARSSQRQTALRCLYLICSFIAVALDYSMRNFFFLEPSERAEKIRDGFTYGSKGASGINKILDVSMGLIEQYARDGLAISKQVRSNVGQQLAELGTNSLGEFFAKNEISRSLFGVARDFEQLAMQREFSSHYESSYELRGFLGCFLDYWDIDRVLFSNSR